MNCDKCLGKTTVIETTSTEDFITYRRRKCKVCGRVFCTKEIECSDFDAADAFYDRHKRRKEKSSITK